METLYYMVFGCLSVVVATLEFSNCRRDRTATSAKFISFKNNYLIVDSLMNAGHHLRVSYGYFFYMQYGLGEEDIKQLQITGWTSSILFGTMAGALADKRGRKTACVTCCIAYLLCCITQHSSQYKILMLGQMFGGIANSLRLSAFESWLVAEHNKRGFEPQWLSITFSRAISLGSALIAIATLPLSSIAADIFDASICVLVVAMTIILSSWHENYGGSIEKNDLLVINKVAAMAIVSDERIALLGAIQLLFQISSRIFVCMWPLALNPNNEIIPLETIATSLMLSIMLGSSIASWLMAHGSIRVERYMTLVLGVSATICLLPIVTNVLLSPPVVKHGSISFAGCMQLFTFCVFEVCVGIFFPYMMKMRSQYIPEEARSTIMNFFGIPIDIFVCVIHFYDTNIDIKVKCGLCSIFLLVATILLRRLSIALEFHRSRFPHSSSLELDAKVEPLLM